MSDGDHDSFGRLLSAVLSEVSGAPEVPPPWRLGGITSVREVAEWVESGVIDAHRAGVLRAAGIKPHDILGIVCEGETPLGRAFSLGAIGLDEVIEIVASEKLESTG